MVDARVSKEGALLHRVLPVVTRLEPGKRWERKGKQTPRVACRRSENRLLPREDSQERSRLNSTSHNTLQD